MKTTKCKGLSFTVTSNLVTSRALKIKFWASLLLFKILSGRKEHDKLPQKCCEREIKLYHLSLKLEKLLRLVTGNWEEG